MHRAPQSKLYREAVKKAQTTWRQQSTDKISMETGKAVSSLNGLLAMKPPRSIAEVSERDERFRNTIMGLSPKHVDVASAADVATLLRACARFKHSSAEVLANCIPRIFKLLPTLTPDECTRLIVLLRDYGRREQTIGCSQSVAYALVVRATQDVSGLNPRSASALLDCISHLQSGVDASSNISVMEMAEKVRDRIAELHSGGRMTKAQDLCRSLVGLCRVFGPDAVNIRPLFRALCEECCVLVSDLSVRDIVALLEALVDIGWVNWEVYTALGNEVGRQAHIVGRHDAGRVLAVFAKTDIECGDLADVLGRSRSLGRRDMFD